VKELSGEILKLWKDMCKLEKSGKKGADEKKSVGDEKK